MAVVHVPPSEATPVAKSLLEAAEYLGLPASVVVTTSDGMFGFSFVVPDEVEHVAMHGTAQPKDAEEPKAPVKRAAKKAAKRAAEPEVEDQE